ncbi:MAG: hypothetical protein JSR83_00830 [Proteobacteria bacterium]|nr:hypothetical protein [Pseudomonadota bacterium]
MQKQTATPAAARLGESTKDRSEGGKDAEADHDDSEHREKAASRYLDIAKNTAGRSSTIAVLWLAAVLVIWWSIELAVSARVETIREAAAAYREADVELGDVKQQEDKAAGLASVELKQLATRKNAAATKRDAAGKKLTQENVEPVDFQLPGFQKFRVPPAIAPAVLSFIILLLALYLTVVRRRTFLFLGRGLRIMLGELRTPMAKIGDVLCPRVWSITPLPRRSGVVVSSNNFANALGWRSPQQAVPIGILVFWVTLFALQLRLTTLGTDLVQPFVELSLSGTTTGYVRKTGLLALYVAMLLTTVSLGICWFLPSTVPDDILEPDAEIKFERRHFAAHITVGLTAFILTSIMPVRTTGTLRRLSRVFGLSRNPRFREQAALAAASGADGLRLSARSRLVRLVQFGRIVGTRNAKVKVLDSVESPAAMTGNSRVIPVRNCVSVICEHAARSALVNRQFELAMTILLEGIKMDLEFKRRACISMASTPRVPAVSIRLYDMVARESVHAGNREWLEKLMTFINDNGLSSAFSTRKEKWTNPKNKWHRSVISQGRSSKVG